MVSMSVIAPHVTLRSPEPALLADLCRTFRLAPQSLSKYRLGATALGVVSLGNIQKARVILDRLEVKVDPRGALDGGADGLACYRSILPAARSLLAPRGRLFLEIGASQAEGVGRLAAGSGLKVIGHFRDLAGHERCLAATLA